jgi:hypothetical protein
MSGVRLILVAGITPMTNEKESVISVQSEYIERKKLELSNKAWNCDCELSLSNPQTVIVNKFLSDMAQEIFSCLPEEKIISPGCRCNDCLSRREFNSCRSTFLENIKKLK